jgi:hypothetical protein
MFIILILVLLTNFVKGGYTNNMVLRCARGGGIAAATATFFCKASGVVVGTATAAATTVVTAGTAALAAPATGGAAGGLSWAACEMLAATAGCTLDIVQGEFRAWWQVSGGIDACFDPESPMGRLPASGASYLYCDICEVTNLIQVKPKETVVISDARINSSDGVDLEVSFTYTVDGNYSTDAIKRTLLRHKSSIYGVSLVESLFETQMKICFELYAISYTEAQLKDPMFFVNVFPNHLNIWFEAVLGIPPPFTVVFNGRTISRY